MWLLPNGASVVSLVRLGRQFLGVDLDDSGVKTLAGSCRCGGNLRQDDFSMFLAGDSWGSGTDWDFGGVVVWTADYADGL